MKIGFFTDAYFPQLNGVVTSVYETVKELRKRGHEVFIITSRYPNYKDNDKLVIRLSSMPFVPKINVRLATHLPEKSLFNLYRRKFDMIHAHSGGMISILALEMARLRRIPIVFTYHTLWNRYTHHFANGLIVRPKMMEIASRLYCNFCQTILVPSEKAKTELISYGVTKPIVVLPYFIDYEKFATVKKTFFLHDLLHLPKTAPIILTVGRLGKEKNFAFLVKMYKELAKKEKSSHLVLVGQGPDKEKLAELSGDLLNKRIHFVGTIDTENMPHVFASSSIFTFASDTETQGICVLEAGASGLPLVVAKDPVFEEVVIDGQTGYALPLDQKLFVEKMEYLLKNPDIAIKLGENAKEMIGEKFNGEKIINQLISIYEQTIATYKPRGRVMRRVTRATLSSLSKAAYAVNKFLELEI